MTDIGAAIALRDMVQDANGPDREIDFAIYEAFSPVNTSKRQVVRACDAHLKYTASIDAAVYLVEKVLPGWQHVTWGGVFPYPSMAEVRSGAPECIIGEGKAETLPLAILDALFAALIKREGGGGAIK